MYTKSVNTVYQISCRFDNEAVIFFFFSLKIYIYGIVGKLIQQCCELGLFRFDLTFQKKYYLIGQKYVQKILSDTFKKFAFKHLFFYSSVKKSGICLFLTGSETLLISFMYF